MIRNLLAASLLLTSFTLSARTLYLKADPALDESKIIPTQLKVTDNENRPTALMVVTSDLPDLQFSGDGVVGEPKHLENKYYAIPLRQGCQQFTVMRDGVQPLSIYIRKGVKSGKVYEVDVYEDEDNLPGAFRQNRHSLPVSTDPESVIYIDGIPLEETTYAPETLVEITSGRHKIYAERVLNATSTGKVSHAQARTFYSPERTINVNPESTNLSEVKVPVTGAIIFTPHEKHRWSTVNAKIQVDPKSPTLNNEPSVIPEVTTFTDGTVIENLRGNYLVTYSANGYKTKKSRYTVAPGDKVNAEIKLDPKSANYWMEYVFSPSAVFGLEIGGCGKYIGWSVRGGGAGFNDPFWSKGADDSDEDSGASWNVQTGPVIRFLRTKTSAFLTLTGGYGQLYFDSHNAADHLSSWMVSAKISFRFPGGCMLGVGYNHPLKSYDGPSSTKDWQRFFISIGGSF